MHGVLREIMKDDLIREGIEGEKRGEKKGAADAYKAMAERMIDDNMPGDKIQLFTSLNRSEIDSLARLRNRTVNWETSATA